MKTIIPTITLASLFVVSNVAFAANPTAIPHKSNSNPTLVSKLTKVAEKAVPSSQSDPNQEVGTLVGALAGGLLGYYFTKDGSTTKKIVVTTIGTLAGGYLGRTVEQTVQHQKAK
jgi:uncharacterized protein YcfJ